MPRGTSDGIEPRAETFREQNESDRHQARQGADQQRQDQENLFFPVGKQCVPVAGGGFPPAGVILFRGLRHIIGSSPGAHHTHYRAAWAWANSPFMSCVPKVLNRRAVRRGVVFRILSGTPSSHFPLDRFLRTAAVAIPALEQCFDSADQHLSGRAQLTDAFACDLFEKAFAARQ